MKKKLIILIVVILIISIMYFIYRPKREEKMINLTNKTIEEIKEYSNNKKLKLTINEEYNELPVGTIKQSIVENQIIKENDELIITISKEKIDENYLKEKHVNELGRIPVMMYHGIINMKDEETKYTGGNVDKDGYQRTTESFKRDLEFYYKNNYRMIRLKDYIEGIIDVQLGYSPIILTFDDGLKNNINILGIDEENELIIDPNSAVGILEQFKQTYPDYNITATFFVNGGLFEQSEYNEKIFNWLINHGYDIGNHTYNHVDISKITESKTEEEIGKTYQKLENIIGNKYVDIVALPFGSPYKLDHPNFKKVLTGTYQEKNYETSSTLRVGWESDYSPFSTDFNKTFIKRIRAYDNNSKDFDIEQNFKLLEKNRYISDGNKDTITIQVSDSNKLSPTKLEVITLK